MARVLTAGVYGSDGNFLVQSGRFQKQLIGLVPALLSVCPLAQLLLDALLPFHSLSPEDPFLLELLAN